MWVPWRLMIPNKPWLKSAVKSQAYNVAARCWPEWATGLEARLVAVGFDETPVRDHNPASATPFDREHPTGTGNDLARADLDEALWTFDKSDSIVNVTNNPVRDQL